MTGEKREPVKGDIVLRRNGKVGRCKEDYSKGNTREILLPEAEFRQDYAIEGMLR